jgi:hypothetical protein
MEPMKPMEPMKGMEPMKPMEPVSDSGWWPDGLGAPSSSGSQNGMRYAFFASAHRLAIETEGKVTLYDSGDHRINGVSQQDGGSRSLAFSSDDGPVRVEDLHEAK